MSLKALHSLRLTPKPFLLGILGDSWLLFSFWLTWLLQLQLSNFIFTSVTCPLVPLFQLPFYLQWHFVPNIMLTGTTNLLHLLWFEKCSQNPSSQLLCGVFLQKKSVPFVILHLLPQEAFSISYIALNRKDENGISLPPWHILSHLGAQEMTISTNGFHERIVWWIIFVVDSLSSWLGLSLMCKLL